MVVVTGGAGFIGGNLVQRLNAEGEDRILVVDFCHRCEEAANLRDARILDWMDPETFAHRLEEGPFASSIRAIFHQGACTDTLEHDRDYLRAINYEYSRSLLRQAVRREIPFVYASSASVYGRRGMALAGPDSEAPLNPYAESKLMFDRLVRRQAAQIRSTVVGLRYFNVYGEGEAHKGRMASMVLHLYRQLKETGTATLFGASGSCGPGEQRRDFVHVSDVAAVNVHFWQRTPVQAIVDVGSGVDRSWNDLASLVIRHLGFGEIRYVDFPEKLRSQYQEFTLANLQPLRDLGYDRKTKSLEEGIARYVAWLEGVGDPASPALVA